MASSGQASMLLTVDGLCGLADEETGVECPFDGPVTAVYDPEVDDNFSWVCPQCGETHVEAFQ